MEVPTLRHSIFLIGFFTNVFLNNSVRLGPNLGIARFSFAKILQFYYVDSAHKR